MTHVYCVTGYAMAEKILNKLVKQNKNHSLWTSTNILEKASHLRERVLESFGITFRKTQNLWGRITDETNIICEVQPHLLLRAPRWTTPFGLVVRQPYKVRKEMTILTTHLCSRFPGNPFSACSCKQLSCMGPNLIHSLDASHRPLTSIDMQNHDPSIVCVVDSYSKNACNLPTQSCILRQQFVTLKSNSD
ncbi:hypothetical protein TRVL_09545 [Trypanosoma vivax]|nr:hypothetical protein TRVL_09545 [Trypanosoma vivax]